ncbi:MAG: hypothetical protein ACFCD0_14355 [Gemmataceae bacterium]
MNSETETDQVEDRLRSKNDCIQADWPDDLGLRYGMEERRLTTNLRKFVWVDESWLTTLTVCGVINPLAYAWVGFLGIFLGWQSLPPLLIVAHMFAFNAALLALLNVPVAIATQGQPDDVRRRARNWVLVIHVGVSLIGGSAGLGRLFYLALGDC